MRLKNTNYPTITLTNLLRRRKTNLKEYVSQNGIATYETLVQRCNRLGVSAPTEEEFNVLVPRPVSSPTEGVVVLPPPPVVLESTGEKLVEEPEVTPETSVTQQVIPYYTKKKRR